MAGDLAAFDSRSHGLEAMRRRFNGLDELLRRPDAGKCLVDQFQQMPLEKIPGNHNLDQQPNWMTLSLVTVLLAQESIQGSLSNDDALRLAKVCLRGDHTLRMAHLRVYGSKPTTKSGLLTLAAAIILKRGIVVKHGRGALSPDDFDPVQAEALIKISTPEGRVVLPPGGYERWQAALEKLEAAADMIAVE